MADWKKILSRGDVEDRRSFNPVVVGGISFTGIAVFLLVNYLSGGSIESGLQEVGKSLLQQQTQQVQTQDTGEFVGEDPYEVFVSTVLGSNNDFWTNEFKTVNNSYTKPKIVLFRQATESGCGGASSEMGPHYCSADNTIYLDETFFDEMTNRFGAQGGDVAQAYVIAHEVGHHVQNILGNLGKASENNTSSIKIELQADCYAGIWAKSIKDQGILESGEIREAMDAAASIGDDRIQKKVQGYANPETFTHGTSEERLTWFTTGYDKGNLNACDTFK
jgi:predicted metalloprotease